MWSYHQSIMFYEEKKILQLLYDANINPWYKFYLFLQSLFPSILFIHAIAARRFLQSLPKTQSWDTLIHWLPLSFSILSFIILGSSFQCPSHLCSLSISTYNIWRSPLKNFSDNMICLTFITVLLWLS